MLSLGEAQKQLALTYCYCLLPVRPFALPMPMTWAGPMLLPMRRGRGAVGGPQRGPGKGSGGLAKGAESPQDIQLLFSFFAFCSFLFASSLGGRLLTCGRFLSSPNKLRSDQMK